MLYSSLYERAAAAGEYIARTGATVRAAAAKLGISKSTVHKDVSERLKYADPALYARVCEVLDRNRAERHLRGGLATRLKYAQIVDNRKDMV